MEQGSREHVIYLILSLTGLLILIFLVNKPDQVVHVNQVYFTGIPFMVICVLGVIAGVSPKSCSRDSIHDFSELIVGEENSKVVFRGHHPDCGCFTGHVLKLGGSTLCSGCSGLTVGGTLSILFVCFYILKVFSLTDSFILFYFGVVFVVLGLIQHYIDMGNQWLHFILNVVFVLGAAVIFVSVDSNGGGFWVQLYFLALCLLWIITRIVLSKKTHNSICANCRTPCGLYFE